MERIRGAKFQVDEYPVSPEHAAKRTAAGAAGSEAGARRLAWRRHGLLIEFAVTAEVGRFDLSSLLMAVAEGLAVLEIGSSIMSFVLCPGPPGAVERPKRSAQ